MFSNSYVSNQFECEVNGCAVFLPCVLLFPCCRYDRDVFKSYNHRHLHWLLLDNFVGKRKLISRCNAKKLILIVHKPNASCEVAAPGNSERGGKKNSTKDMPFPYSFTFLQKSLFRHWQTLGNQTCKTLFSLKIIQTTSFAKRMKLFVL